MNAAPSEDVFGSGLRPEHARLFATSAKDGLATGFDHTRTDEVARCSEGSLLPPAHVANKAAQGLLHDRCRRFACAWLARFFDQCLDFVFEPPPGLTPQLLFVIRMGLADQRIEDLAGVRQRVEEVHALPAVLEA